MKCLYCYNDIIDGTGEFHTACSRKIFGSPIAPELPYTLDQISELAGEIISTSTTLTGVQAKLSLHLEKKKQNGMNRLTIIGLWGGFILKPPAEQYKELPELEDLTMHLSEIFNIKVVPHSLIRLRSGELSYITKRIDRPDTRKNHMEDMCQLTEKLTEDKYRGSMELVGRTIRKYSNNKGLDLTSLFEVTVFYLITGNADMHLKNFSLIRMKKDENILAPAYDLLPTKIVLPEDQEESALSINGKKKNITMKDLIAFGRNMELTDKQIDNVMNKFRKKINTSIDFIERSFVSDMNKSTYKDIIREMAGRYKLI